MNVSSIFSARNISLLVFILVVLFLGATFDVKVGPESFTAVYEKPKSTTSVASSTAKPTATTQASKYT
jgi:hypothetical protein